MNVAHLHLITTHLPVCGAALGLGLLLWAAFRRSRELQQTALGVLVLAALLALPAYFSGAPAARLLRTAPGVARETVDRHLEVAQLGLGSVLTLGAGALASLIVFRKRTTLPAWNLLLLALLALVSAGLLFWTASLGGQVRHPEIRGEQR
jgi:hypothetical protein